MIFKYFFLVGLLSTFLIHSSAAQSSIDLITIGGRHGFSQQAGSPIEGRNSEFGGLINLKIPIALSKNTMWYNSITHFSSYVRSDAALPSDVANPINAQGTILQTGIIQTINETQKIHLLFMPRFMSDGINVTTDNFQFGGIALFENRYRKDLMMRFGVFFTVEEFGPALTPLVHVDWQISSKWSIVGMLPIDAKINYKVNKNLTTGFSHFVLITSYRQGNLAYQNDYIERVSIDLTLFARQRLFGNIFLEARAGYAMGRKYEQFTEDQKIDFRFMIFDFGSERVLKNEMMRGGPIVNFRLVYNLPLD